MDDGEERALERHVIRVGTDDVFGPSSGPLEQRVREMARSTLYSFEQIRVAILAVNVRRRDLRLPEIPREDWLAIMQPGAQLATMTGHPLADSYWSVTQAASEAWITPVTEEPRWDRMRELTASLQALDEPPSREQRSFKSGLRRQWWDR